MSKYHYIVLSVKPTRKASEIQTLLNAAASRGYRLLKIEDEGGEVYSDKELGQLIVSDLYFFERESETTTSTVTQRADDPETVYLQIGWRLFKDEKWDDLEKLIDWIAINVGIEKAQRAKEWFEKKREQKNQKATNEATEEAGNE